MFDNVLYDNVFHVDGPLDYYSWSRFGKQSEFDKNAQLYFIGSRCLELQFTFFELLQSEMYNTSCI